eukprot:TRINITY_DN4288_c0_g1_i1.p1 TRINITY_DN4288_c0_g1~~TRINITY_DN4288_c0_g1_i1.p1  ORF type:complete len:395 (+),score=18.05 TRINITY_DN4288_c0_g1_i1:34-1218(+)
MATPASTPSGSDTSAADRTEFIRLVKAFDHAGLSAFLDQRPGFDVNFVSQGFGKWPGSSANEYRPALMFACLQPEDGERETFLDGTDRNRMVRTLVAHGADLDRTYGADQATVLHMSCSEPSRLLLELGASVDPRDSEGATPLHYSTGNTKGLKVLLEHGADPNARDADGDTPLHDTLLADEDFDIQCVDALLSAGGDLFLRNKSNRTTLDGLRLEEGDDTDDQQAKKKVMNCVASLVAFAIRIRKYLDAGSAHDVTLEFASEPARTASGTEAAAPQCQQVHRWILEASSQKFRAMFHSGMKEASGFVKLERPFDKPMQQLLQFLYGKPVDFDSWEEIRNVFELADSLPKSYQPELQGGGSWRLLARRLDQRHPAVRHLREVRPRTVRAEPQSR